MTTPKNPKLWHPSLDVYHSVFRSIRLLVSSYPRPIPIEKLYILDFYLLFPILLSATKMPLEVRRKFRDQQLQKAKPNYIRLPSAPALYRDMAVIQRTALRFLTAKGILNRDSYLSGEAKLNMDALPHALLADAQNANIREQKLISFLVENFGAAEIGGPTGLRSSTGLVRRELDKVNG